MKKWTKIALAIGLFTVAAGSIAWGGHGGRGHMMGFFMSKHINETLDYIEATPQQRQIVNAVKDEVTAKMKAQHAAHQGAGPQIAQLLAADTLDVNQLNALVDQHAETLRAMGHEMVAEAAKIHAALTPAQRQKLFEKWKARHEQRGQHPQGGFGGQE